MTNGPLRGAVVGCGFFAQNHLHAWNDLRREGAGVEIVAVCDSDARKASGSARRHGVARHFDDLSAMLAREPLDFVDVVTHVSTHEAIVLEAARHGLHVICQKPFAPSVDAARRMIAACGTAGVSLTIHENFRHQRGLRAVAQARASLGRVHFARISFRSAFDVFAAQPYLAEDARFILSDVGVHVLDLARFLMGEVRALACHTQRVNPTIRGEDVATVLLAMASGATAVVDMSYAARLEHETFPQVQVWLEGERGSLALTGDFKLRVTLEGRTHEVVGLDAHPPWARPPFHAVQDSVLGFQREWLRARRCGRPAETDADDNLRSFALVEAAYVSADGGGLQTVPLAKARPGE